MKYNTLDHKIDKGLNINEFSVLPFLPLESAVGSHTT